MNGIDLDKTLVQVAFFDFDDTLVTHLDHSKWDNWFKHCLCGSAEPYLKEGRTCATPGMKDLLAELRKKGITAFCLTWDKWAITVVPKWKVLQEYYGDRTFDNIIVVGSREQKLEFIKRYCEEFNLNPRNILVVDDNTGTLNECNSYGCVVMTPQEVCCRYAG